MSESKKNNNLPPYLTKQLNNAPKNRENIINEISKLDVTNIDNAVAFSMIEKVLRSNETVKTERQNKRTRKKEEPKKGINSTYDVIMVDDKLSKKFLVILRDVRNLSQTNVSNIHEGFLQNNYEEVAAILSTNGKFVGEVNKIVNVLSKAVDEKTKNNKYEENALIFKIASELSIEDLEKIIAAKHEKVEGKEDEGN